MARAGLAPAAAAAESPERLACGTAEGNLASSLFKLQQGKFKEAERMLRRLHKVRMRVYGAEDPGPETRATANDLAQSLSGQLEGPRGIFRC